MGATPNDSAVEQMVVPVKLVGLGEGGGDARS
jgi:hypothetical protein